MDNALSDWESLIVGVIRGFILKLLPFNIFINDVFFFRRKYDLCDHAYDSSLYTAESPFQYYHPDKNGKTTGNEAEYSEKTHCAIYKTVFCCHG